jgi:SIR2-like protein
VPAKTEISSLHWDSIVSRIDSGLCVPFLGAGVNAGTDLPMGADVVNSLLSRLVGKKGVRWSDLVSVTTQPELQGYPDLSRTRAQDLARVALHLELEGNYRAVVDYLKEIITDDGRDPPEILHVLARIPFKLIVTTNYDRLLERAFEIEGKPSPLVVSQPILGFNPTEVKRLQKKLVVAERVVYKLHGSFDDLEPNLVISEDDYIDFLGIAGDEKQGVPRQIRARIKDSVLLFLGYGLEDWDVRSIYSLLIGRAARRERPMSFAIQRDPTPFWVRFWEKKDVTIYNIDLETFSAQLAREYAGRSRAS